MPAQNFSFSSTIANYPNFPYQKIKEAILGSSYDLSFTFIGSKRAQKLNQQYRQKDYVPNVLSFPLDAKCGEIFICPEVAYREAKDYNLSQAGYVAFLFIHGLLHLKGYDHSVKMESLERRYVKQFKIV